jgi:hypothetical protein
VISLETVITDYNSGGEELRLLVRADLTDWKPRGDKLGRSGVAVAGRPVDRAGHGRWERNEDDLCFLTSEAKSPVAMFLAQVADVGAAGFEDPQSEEPEQRVSAKSLGLGESRAVVMRASNCRWLSPRVGDSGGTTGRRT